jgi:two-component system OmpR family response regulator
MRIHAVCRRGAQSSEDAPTPRLDVGELTLEVEAHEVRHSEGTLRLTPTEFRLLYMLAVNVGRVVSAARLVEYAWGYDGNDTSLLKTHICHIRSKVGAERCQIRCVPRVGYKLVQP